MDENKEPGISLAQVKFIKTLCKRENHTEPNYDEMSMSDAKKFISMLLGDTPQRNGEGAPKTMGDVASTETEKLWNIEMVNLLRQILAELKEINHPKETLHVV